MRKRNYQRRPVILLCVAALVALAGSVHAAKEIDEETFRELLQDGKVVKCTIHGSTGEQVEVEGVMETKSGREDFSVELLFTPKLPDEMAIQEVPYQQIVTYDLMRGWSSMLWAGILAVLGLGVVLWLFLTGLWKASSEEQG